MKIDKWISEVRGQLAAATPDNMTISLFLKIGNGDAERQRWLKDALKEWFSCNPYSLAADLTRALDEIERLQAKASSLQGEVSVQHPYYMDKMKECRVLQKQNEFLREGLVRIRENINGQNDGISSETIADLCLARADEIGKS